MLTDKEESRGLVQKNNNPSTMDKGQDDTADKLEDVNSLSPAIMTGIMVSIGIGLFTVFTVVFWLCKARSAKSKEEDKCILVEDCCNSQESDSKLEENLTNDKCCSPSATTSECDALENSKLDGEQSEGIKEPASIEITELQEFDGDMMPNTQGIDVDEEQTDNDGGLVQFGPDFIGNISISSAPDDIDINKQSEQSTSNEMPEVLTMVCNTINEPICGHGILQDTKPDDQTTNISLPCALSLDTSKSGVSGESMSPSLEHFVKINQPSKINKQLPSQDDDGDDRFIFQQDNFVVRDSSLEVDGKPEREPKLKPELEPELEPELGRTFTPPTMSGKGLEISRSLDSQQKILEKGCQLLQTRPRRSSLKITGSDSCLKKFVHFPPDIRNIRMVHKYDSFDDDMLLHNAEHEEE